MSENKPGPTALTSPTPRFLSILLLLFVGSGCSALIYEIVWFQLLQLVIGSSAVSLGVLLATFMGGMCLGSLALPRLVGAARHPLRVYAALEAGIAVGGVAVLFGLPYAGGLYAAGMGTGLPGIALRAILCGICLLPPTLLMGATLPAIARWVETTPKGISWLGFFYGGNIGGAVLGCLAAAFYLLRVHDMATATYAAAAINGGVALIGWGLAKRTPHRKPEAAPAVETVGDEAGGARLVYLAIALSGLSALGSEVVWTRLLSLILGGTVYTFAIILAVFLAGLGIGSSAGSLLARQTARPRRLLGWCQLALAAAIAWTAGMLSQSLPYWPVDPSLSASPWYTFQLDLVRALWAMLPAACLWGASFPLALAAVAAGRQDAGRVVAAVYAANTLGAIAGAIGFGMLMIPQLGTRQAQQGLIVVSVVAGFLMLAPAYWPRRWGGSKGSTAEGSRPWSAALAFVLLWLVSAGLTWSVSEIPAGVVAYGRSLPQYDTLPEFLYVGEGMNASIAVSELENGVRNFHVSGKVEASTEPQDMRLQRMLGNLPALVHPRPRSVLVIGFGAGVTAGSFVPYPEVERIVICEIEPLIVEAVSPFFARSNRRVLDDPRVEVVYDDARHYILTTGEKFDIITSDPIHPWVKGAATLYTREYFDLVRRHLNPGGVVTQWVPLYESDSEVVQSEMATFFDVFPDGTVWGNLNGGQGYDVVLLGRAAPAAEIDVDALQQRLFGAGYADVQQSLGEVGFRSAVDLLATYAGRGPDLQPWLQDAQINRDRDLRLQYLAGLGLNLFRSAIIYQDILNYRRFPEDLLAPNYGKEVLRRILVQP